MFKAKCLISLIWFSVLWISFPSHIHAADKYWLGSCADDDWVNMDCWSSTPGGTGGAALPADGDNAYVQFDETVYTDVTVAYTTTNPGVLNSLILDHTEYNAYSILEHSAGTLFVTNMSVGNQSGGSGKVNLSGGTQNITNLSIAVPFNSEGAR
jgi:hypothetical protein